MEAIFSVVRSPMPPLVGRVPALLLTLYTHISASFIPHAHHKMSHLCQQRNRDERLARGHGAEDGALPLWARPCGPPPASWAPLAHSCPGRGIRALYEMVETSRGEWETTMY